MKKFRKMISLLLAVLLLASASLAFAGTELTHFTGKVGYSVDYPADVLEVMAYGLNTTFVTKDANDTMNITVLPSEELSDPVARLVAYGNECYLNTTEADIQTLKTNAGADVWKLNLPSETAFSAEYIVQDGGREFSFSLFCLNDCREKYEELTEAIVLSFVNEPDGDMSGYDEAMDDDWEPDYYDTLADNYQEGIQLYARAVAEAWDIEKLTENGLSPLLALMENPADSVKLAFISMNPDADASLLLYTDGYEDEKTEVLAMGQLDENGKVRFFVTAGERDSFVLCGNETDGYTLAEYASNSAAQSAVFFWKMNDKQELELAEGILYDYDVDAQNPCFLVKDTDFDASKGTPCTEAEADAIIAKYIPAQNMDMAMNLRDVIEFDLGMAVND